MSKGYCSLLWHQVKAKVPDNVVSSCLLYICVSAPAAHVCVCIGDFVMTSRKILKTSLSSTKDDAFLK